jgi:SPP1 family phage portal protein
MELDYLIENLENVAKVVSEITASKKNPWADLAKQYQPEKHAIVTDTTKRPNKQIEVGTDEKPETKWVYPARLPIPYQKKIVRMRATFLCGNPIELAAAPKKNSKEQDLLDVIKKTWKDNKLDYKSKQMAKMMMSETECAELWYMEDADEFYWQDTPNKGKKERLRVRLLAPSKGDDLYPVYDKYGDMIAFCRGYQLKEEGKDVPYFDIYTAKTIYSYKKDGSGYAEAVQPIDNPFGKIPVIYYNQNAPEWADVQPLIDQYEITLSDHTDNNAYNVAPTTVVKGKVVGFSQKGEQGKILEVDPGADVSLMESQQAVESLELEQKNLRRHILDETSTPDISFEQMQSIGDYSAVALKMLFLDAHMAASDKEEIFGEAIQRRINFLKAAHVTINAEMQTAMVLDISPKFEYYLPKNDLELVQMLTAATTGERPIMAQKTGVYAVQEALGGDGEAEYKQILDEANEVNTAPAGLDRSMRAVV